MDPELAAARAEIARLSEALKEMGVRLTLVEGKEKGVGIEWPVPRRVDAATKAGLLELIDGALAAGWEHRRACAYLEIKASRAWRWERRRAAGCLEDQPAGGHPVHGLLDGVAHLNRRQGADPGCPCPPPGRRQRIGDRARSDALAQCRGRISHAAPAISTVSSSPRSRPPANA